MVAVSPLADFSFDYQDLYFTHKNHQSELVVGALFVGASL